MKRFGLWLMILVCVVLVIWGFASEAQVELTHNEQQIAECRRLGGFALTNTDGWLRSCTFPQGVR